MQLLSTIREDKLFSSIYIAGTAMAITFTMIMAIVYYIKLADIYPEVNRSKTVYLNNITIQIDRGDGGNMCLGMGFHQLLYETYCKEIKNCLYMAPATLSEGNGTAYERNTRRVKGRDGMWEGAVTNMTNQDFFNIYEFEFLSGKPFTEEEVNDGVYTAVITRDFADKIFGKDVDPVGETISIRTLGEYKVCGVVKSASQLTPDSYAEVYAPYTTSKMGDVVMCNFSSVVVMVKDDEQLEALREELNEWGRKMSLPGSSILEYAGGFTFLGDDAKFTVSMTDCLETHAGHMLMTDENIAGTSGTLNDRIIYLLGVIAILLLVPALNLCGIVAGRMEKRLPEMGVRKSFGAKKGTLLLQVIRENMTFTLLGGGIGLVLTWLSLAVFRNTVLELFFDSSLLKESAILGSETMFAPSVFVVALLAIMILNVASATLPAYLSLRKPIVESMNDKQ